MDTHAHSSSGRPLVYLAYLSACRTWQDPSAEGRHLSGRPCLSYLVGSSFCLAFCSGLSLPTMVNGGRIGGFGGGWLKHLRPGLSPWASRARRALRRRRRRAHRLVAKAAL